ncbi:MAG TPA: GGDEF domain-containing protein [Treponemataceae bacterium]|nr:GGDEF domain-containing protein [Treponemataceae bacterium]
MRAKARQNRSLYKFTIGVMIDSVDSFFNHRAISNFIDAAEEKKFRLIFFFGGSLEKDISSGRYSYAYSLPNASQLDALVVVPHSVAPYNPQSTIYQLLKNLPDIPVYSLFAPLQGIWSIYTEDSDPIDQMISHLVEEHKYTKFSILSGPDSGESVSRERKKMIEKVLSRFDISISPEYIYSGSFKIHDGKKTAMHILSSKLDPPDVVICLNDQMAVGLIQEFKNRNIAVPEDIAVVGFDDVEENTSFDTSFTTINFPIWEMVTILTDTISSDLSGITTYSREHIVRSSQFMHRESCGCTSWFEKKTKQDQEFTPLENKRSSQGNLKKIASMRQSLERVIEEWLQTGDNNVFTDFMHSIIASLYRSGDMANSFIDIFSTQWTITLLKNQDFNTQILINSLFVDAFRLLLQIKENSFMKIRNNDVGSLKFYQGCNTLLSQKLSVLEAIHGIGDNIPPLGVSRFILVFLSPENPNIGEIRLSFKAGSFSNTPLADFTQFNVSQILPSEINDSHDPLAILPIAYNNSVYGYLIITISDKQFEQFSMIQDMVSRIIDSAMTNDLLSSHIQNLTNKNSALSQLSLIDQPTGLFNRRALHLTGKAMFNNAKEQGFTSCFIFLDMDGLKKINDTWGHKEGDQAILSLSEILKKSFRENDLVVRYGGDEFVVLMVNINEIVLHRALNRITNHLKDFNASEIFKWTLSVSWGYVFTNPNDLEKSFESVIEESDAALYEQKKLKRAKKK